MQTLLAIEIGYEQDVVLTRQRTRQVAELLGFEAQDQTRIATAVSEITRNAFQYAGGGRVEFRVELETPQCFWIQIQDQGRGIENLDQILSGHYRSPTGMGVGIVGTKRLMDEFEIESSSAGTIARIGKYFPWHSQLTPTRLVEIVGELAQRSPRSPFEEVQQQNQELLQALEALKRREEQLTQLNQELEDTNRGVVALYAELDEKADSLRRANELKTRFLSNMSHEFRTPLNSIVSLTRLLIDRVDGDLTSEQDKQVQFIRKAAEDLSELVNDLLDLAKVEAGKIVLHPSRFEIADLFATLRGMLRPLLAHNSSVALIFDEPIDIPPLETDEGKLAQILRNFISNALKYTQRGEVRIAAVRIGDRVSIAVADTGIGISADDQTRIFEDFIQIESPLQKQFKGTGLGLPLSRKLAELLGGQVTLTSAAGIGSVFRVEIPLVCPVTIAPPQPAPNWHFDPQRLPVLVLEDNPETLFMYEKYLEGSIYQPLTARTIRQAQQLLQQVQPVAIMLDVLLETQHTWELLTQLKAETTTRSIPILVITIIDNEKRAKANGADAFALKPIERLHLLNQINILVKVDRPQTLLLIDDDPIACYLFKQQLLSTHVTILEADSGQAGLAIAHSQPLDAIVLDLAMPEMSGAQVLDQLQQNSATSRIPVIIHTSEPLSDITQKDLIDRTIAVLPKGQTVSASSTLRLHEALLKAGIALEEVDRE